MRNTSKYVGTPYGEMDCWKLVCTIYKEEFDILLDPLPIQTKEREFWEEVTPSKEQAGDLLVFRMAELKRHVGIVLGGGRMIHSDEAHGVVTELYRRDIWNSRLQTIYRHK